MGFRYKEPLPEDYETQEEYEDALRAYEDALEYYIDECQEKHYARKYSRDN